jgi:choline kinase
MNAIILAAGISSRLRPLTDSLPKCLLQVGGRTLLERTLATLGTHPFERILLVTGYKEELIRDIVPRLPAGAPVEFVRNARYAETSNAYSLWLALARAAGAPFLMLDSDILFHPGILTRMIDTRRPNVIALRESSSTAEEEVKIEQDASGRILRIGKEIPPERSAGESIGIERFSSPTGARLLEVLSRRKERNEFYEASFQELLERGEDMRSVPCGDLPAIEIDTPEDLRQAESVAREIDR